MMRAMHARKRGGLSLTLALIFAGALLVPADAQTTRAIPFAGPLSGPIATYGLEVVHGALLAAEDINRAGGLKAGPWKGHQIKIEQFDDRGDPTESANIAQKLAINKDVVAIIGHIFSSNCLSALPIYEQAHLNMVTPICSNPVITERGFRSVFRVVQDDVANGIAQVDMAIKVLGGKRLGVLYANQDYGRGLYEVGTKRARELGVPFVAEPYNEGETDFNAIIGRFKAANVNMIVHFGFYTEAALQRRQALQQGLNVPFFAGPGVVSSEFIRLGGADVEGVIVLDFMKQEMDSPKLRELATRTKEKFNEGFNLYHRNGYDAMMFLAKGLESAKDESRASVNAALRRTQIRGLTYDIKLNEKGNLIVPMERLSEYYFLKVVKGGKFVDYKPH